MTNAEKYRYFWIKVSDEKARAASARAALELQQTFLARSMETKPGSPEARSLQDQRLMARKYLGGDVVNGTRIVIIAAEDAPTSIDVLPTTDYEGPQRALDVSIAAMPKNYERDTSLEWIRSPVGQAWAAGSAICRLSYAVVSPSSGA